MEPGRLIVLEGPDGVGKTSVANHLQSLLSDAQINCVSLAYPGNESRTLGKLVYDLHHESEKFDVSHLLPECKQTLHIAAHIEAILKQILPALQNDTIVILDRYWWSTWVYGMIDGLSPEFLSKLIEIELMVWGAVRPDIFILLERKESLKNERSIEYWGRIKAEYESLCGRESTGSRIEKLVNENSLDKTVHEIVSVLQASRILPRSL